MNKFNDDQIEVIKTALKNQEVVWSKNKQDRQYYDADLSELNQCDDDEHFDTQWGCNDHEQQEISFYEWCSLYDDLKHIKQRKVA
jgi:hypothetical protein